MMNRRARIKGIANIPVRRKTEVAASNEKSEPVVSSEKQDVEENSDVNKNTDTANDTIKKDIKTESSPEKHESSHNVNLLNTSNNEVQNTKECENITSETNNDLAANANPTISRRWVPKPKPIVKNPSMLRRPKPVLVPLKEKTETVINQNIENEKPPLATPVVEEINNLPSVQNSTQNIETSTSTPNNSVIKPSEPEKILTCPLSPNKLLNRARIRPTPKLIRRNSIQGSASESEDDGRRSRIRNDSVCSTTSYSTEITVKENTTVSKEKIISIKVHKLFRRSEQSRKVSEARKDFYHKFGSAIPDRKRLTMMDLIYYNPTTNPMPQRKQNTTIEEINLEEIEDEENEDEPEEPEEEDSNPVPQVKVGPNGEIILDEQSLVIEQTGTKKGREKLANSQVVNADDLDRNYGIYKRPKRSKDWSAIETLRFYRSLNTVGTDFSLMVSLFPGRTRRELKMKFKKEEKINRQLIDKALTNPLDFDLSELEKQLKDEEELIKKMELEQKQKKLKAKRRVRISSSVLAAEMEEENEDEPLIKKTKVIRPQRNQKGIKDRYAALNVGEITTSESEPEYESPIKKIKQEKVNLSKRDSYKENCDNVPNILFNQNKLSPKKEESLATQNKKQNCDDEEETELPITPNEKQNNETQEMESNINETFEEETNENVDITEETMECKTENSVVNDQNCVVPNILPNDLSTVEPGSLMILSTAGPDGQQIFKVFMVTQGQSKVPINLSEDVVQSLATSLGSAEAVTLDLPVINESEVVSQDTI